LTRRSECAAASLARFGIVSGDREDGQEPVAHELEHLAPVVEDRRNLTIEIAIEQIDQDPRRHTVGL